VGAKALVHGLVLPQQRVVHDQVIAGTSTRS
jgi:hypothetical protein